MSILKRTNSAGFPSLETVGVELTTTAETFSLNYHPNFRANFQGGFWLLVRNTPTAPRTAVPIRLATAGFSGSEVPVRTASGAAVTTANWPGDGVYLFFYDRTTNVLRIENLI